MPVLHPVRHDGGDACQRLADRAGVDKRAGRLHAGAENRVGRRADAQPLRLRPGHDREAVGDRYGERLFGIDVLSRVERPERHVGMGVGNGEVEDDVDVVAPEQFVDASRLDRVTLGLPRSGLRIEVRAGGDDDVAEARRVRR